MYEDTSMTINNVTKTIVSYISKYRGGHLKGFVKKCGAGNIVPNRGVEHGSAASSCSSMHFSLYYSLDEMWPLKETHMLHFCTVTVGGNNGLVDNRSYHASVSRLV